ncbi:MAG: hypothetical protein A2505_06255 [Deltaproteobacteria bacterium RIFOXYD12_FULL_55_16]|nr:MAG: hypothetical protein A2505_06255 [Deltaproteobacteria bacterium RIFOXYD12_FULL_55_16]
MGKLSSCNDRFIPALTNHASARMGSRRISHEDVAVVMGYGRVYHVRGAVIYVMGRREVASCLNDGLLSPGINGLQVVCSPEDDTVITVYRNKDFRGLRCRNARQDFT